MLTTLVTRFFQWLRAKRIRRFEFLLPTKYNDGTEIEPEKLNQTTRELSGRFGGLAQDLVQVHGLWLHKEETYLDELIRLRIDTPDPEAVTFLRTYKRQLKDRFKQLDIWITAQVIEII
jgi:hypothetical protein